MTMSGATIGAVKDLSGVEEREMPDLGDIDVVTSEEIWQLALKEYSVLKLETETSHRDIMSHSSAGGASIQESSDQKRSASVGPTGSRTFKSRSGCEDESFPQTTRAQTDRAPPDKIKRARSESLGQATDKDMPAASGSSSKGKMEQDNGNEKVHVPYYYRVTRHASETGMASKTFISQSKEARKSTHKTSKQLKDRKKNRHTAAAAVNSTHATQKTQPVITFEQNAIKESQLMGRKQLAASVSPKSSKHSKKKSVKSRSDVNQYDATLMSSASVRSSNSYKGGTSSVKDSPSRAASTPTAKKRKGRKKHDETASRKTQGSRMSIFSSAKERIYKIFGISLSKKVKRNTADTVPMDILNIRMDSSVWNNVPGSTRDLADSDPPVVRIISGNERRSTLDYSDHSLTMGTPKRDPAVGWHDSDTPVSCLSVPVFETGDVHSSPKIKPRKPKYKNRNSNGSEVFDMPWSNDVFHGKYSGPIDSSLNPHGKGAITIKGVWEHGELVFPEINGLTRVAEAIASTTLDRCNTNHSEPRSSIVFNKGNVTSPVNDEQTVSTAPLTLTNSAVDRNVSDRSSISSIDAHSSVVSENDPASTNQSVHQNSIESRNGRNSIKPKWAYKIGQVSRSPNDMIIHRSNFDAIDSVSMIQNMQQAFVKRSSGLWTCAVLVERALQPINGKRWYPEWEINNYKEAELEESMLFVINDDGSTKIVNRRNWGKFVRRMKTGVNGKDVSHSGCGPKLSQGFETIKESETLLSDSEGTATCEDSGTSSDGAGNHPSLNDNENEGEEEAAALDVTVREPFKEDTLSDATVEVSNREENNLCDAIEIDCKEINSEVNELDEKREAQGEKSLDVSIEIEKEVFMNKAEEKDDVFKKSNLTASTVLSRSSLAGSSLSNSMLNDIDW